MIEVKAVTHSKIKSKRIQLRDRPDRVDVKLRPNDDVLLLIDLGQVDVVVIFDSGRDTEPETNRAERGDCRESARSIDAALPRQLPRRGTVERRLGREEPTPGKGAKKRQGMPSRTRGIGWVLKSIGDRARCRFSRCSTNRGRSSARTLEATTARKLRDNESESPSCERFLLKICLYLVGRFLTGMQRSGQAKSCHSPRRVFSLRSGGERPLKRPGPFHPKKASRAGAVKAVIETVPGSQPLTTLFSPARTFCVVFILNSLVLAHGQTHRPSNEKPTRADWKIEYVTPGYAKAINLTVNDAKTRFRLNRGVTSFIIPLSAPNQRRCFTLENESIAAKGSFSIATANERLAVKRWQIGTSLPARSAFGKKGSSISRSWASKQNL